MFWKETRNYCIPHMMMTLKRRFKGGGAALVLFSGGRTNKEWYTYKKVDHSESLPTMWVGEAGKGFLVSQGQREEGKHCRL